MEGDLLMTQTTVNDRHPYSWAVDRTEEDRRLAAQSRLLDPWTEQLLRQAGLRTGMHVVDLGSGAGDSAIVAARLVGPTGSVLGVERSPEQVALARRHVADLGLSNVTFRVGDVAALEEVLADHPVPVDAVIGRLILMWVTERDALLRACARSLPPGALVWFLDVDATYDYAVPSSPLWDRLRGWVVQTLVALGAETRMGPKLHRAFRDAGLPSPLLESRTIMAGAQTAPLWFALNAVRGFLPAMEALGVASAAEVAIDTLEARLTADLAANDAVMIAPPFTAAWARVPA
jgi:ubiquinone/menaquinone biosynthesis C-methylase UbiE